MGMYSQLVRSRATYERRFRKLLLGVMIAGAFPQPSFTADFRTGVADPRFTYSGGAGGTCVNNLGNVTPTVCPRIDYDPTTLVCKGLLDEEQRTNLALQSANFGTTWSKAAGVTDSLNAVNGPDGTLSADKLIEGTANQRHYHAQTVTIAANTTYTFTCFLKAAERNFAGIVFGKSGAPFTRGGVYVNLTTGATSTYTSNAPSSIAVSAVPWSNGWWRVVVTVLVDATSTDGYIEVWPSTALGTNTYLGDGVSGIYAWGAQLEAGSFATSYIPTTTAAVTRTADKAVLTGAAFAAWYNQGQGTFIAEADCLDFSASRGIFAAGDPTLPFATGEVIYGTFSTTGPGRFAATVLDGGVGQGTLSPAPVPAINTMVKVVVTYAANNLQAATNGTLAVQDNAATLPTPTALSVGGLSSGWNGGASPLNGHVRVLRYYPKRMLDSQLTRLTT